jgi:FAD:protein FMN transferase
VAESSAAGLCRVEEVMGIPVGIDVRDPRVDPDVLDRAFARLRWVDATFSTYRPDSAISRLNDGTLALRDADPDVRDVLDRCEDLRARTGGCFDVRARGPLDPSAFVKGWAVEAVAAMLGEAGARNLCVHAGGDVCVRGERVPGRPWRVGIQHPVATSGAYERGPHIVDPRTGRAPRGVASVTILGPDLAVADAYATAAFAMGVEGPAWTAGLDDYDALTILADGRVLSTPGVDAVRAQMA